MLDVAAPCHAQIQFSTRLLQGPAPVLSSIHKSKLLALISSRDAERLRSISADTRSALAATVRDGLIAPLVGMKEASVIKRLAIPCARQFRSTTPVEGSSLITHVPQG